MKKLLSIMMAVAMLVTLFVPMTASAAVTHALPTEGGESITWEIENSTGADGATWSGFAYAAYTYQDPEQTSGTVWYGSATYNHDQVGVTYTVSVAEDTLFEVETVAGALDGNFFVLDGNVVFKLGAANGTDLGWTPSSAYGNAYKYTFHVYIPAGDHTFGLRMLPRNNGTANGAYILDYIKLTAVDYTPSEPETFAQWEMENFDADNAAGIIAAINGFGTPSVLAGVSGNLWQCTGYATSPSGQITYSFTVAEDTFFQVEAVADGFNANFFALDGREIFRNGTNGTNMNVAGSYGAYKYTFYMFVPAGEHTFGLKMNKRNNGQDALAFLLDYIKLTKIGSVPAATPEEPEVTENVAVSGTEVSGTVVYDEAVSGKLIVAAYAGKELVGCADIVDINSASAEISLACTKAPDTVKVMVWSDMSSTLAPVAPLKVFTFGE